MGIKLVHESLKPKTDPDIFGTALESVQNMRDNRCVGFVIVSMIDVNGEIQVEWERHIGEDENPRYVLEGIIAVGQEILQDYEIDDFVPGEIFEQ